MSEGLRDYSPAYLGKNVSESVEKVDLIPWESGAIKVTLSCEEFTALCPVTRQPDFGRLEISYSPGDSLIESKSLKLYLLKFRSEGVFGEMLIARIADELWQQVEPEWLRVKGSFNPRGGIAIEAEVSRGEVE